MEDQERETKGPAVYVGMEVFWETVKSEHGGRTQWKMSDGYKWGLISPEGSYNDILARQMEHFMNPLDLFNISIW